MQQKYSLREAKSDIEKLRLYFEIMDDLRILLNKEKSDEQKVLIKKRTNTNYKFAKEVMKKILLGIQDKNDDQKMVLFYYMFRKRLK